MAVSVAQKPSSWSLSEYREWLPNVFVSVLFAWMVYKLALVLSSFKSHELKVARRGLHLESEDDFQPQEAEEEQDGAEIPRDTSEEHNLDQGARVQGTSRGEGLEVDKEELGREESGVAVHKEQGKQGALIASHATRSSTLAESDDDWEAEDGEGMAVNREVEEVFEVAATYVAASAMAGKQLPRDKQLLLYALYKQATVGPCQAPRPSAISVAARAKWDAWASQQALPREEAMKRYIGLLSEADPGWSREGGIKEEGTSRGQAEQGRPGGPVFSTPIELEGEAGDHRALSGLLACASGGDEPGLAKLLEAGAAVDQADEEGRTALHWAVDRGHLGAVKVLLKNGANPSSQDVDGQTPLHYAAVCEFEEIAAYLLQNGGSAAVKDKEGDTPEMIKPSGWDWKT